MKKKVNNKGFSLVELIVVIAIMGVLVGIAAPQFLKYVESSRRATDVKNGQEIAIVVQAAIADEVIKENGTVTIPKAVDLTTVTGSGAEAQLKTALKKFFGDKGPDLKSKGATSYKVNFNLDGTIEVFVVVANQTPASLNGEKKVYPENEYK